MTEYVLDVNDEAVDANTLELLMYNGLPDAEQVKEMEVRRVT
jgi:hypothetical protein